MLAHVTIVERGSPARIEQHASDYRAFKNEHARRGAGMTRDALSFFSLNSTGFLHYYGVEHTRRKIAYTLARLRESAWWRLAGIRYHPVVAALLQEAQAPSLSTTRTPHTPQESHGERNRSA